MANVYYAVKKGWAPGVYESYDSFLKAIYKFEGVEFEKFDKLSEANEYLKEIDQDKKAHKNYNIKKKQKVKSQKTNQVLLNEQKPLYPYALLGSYISNGFYGFGGFIKTTPSSSPLTFKGFGNEKEMYDNFGLLAGEMLAIVNATNKAIQMDLKQINIYYNNSKINELNGGFSINDSKGIKNYKIFMINAKKKIKINLIEVKQKSQDSGAILATKLAREAVNSK